MTSVPSDRTGFARIKQWARETCPDLQNLRQAIKACACWLLRRLRRLVAPKRRYSVLVISLALRDHLQPMSWRRERVLGQLSQRPPLSVPRSHRLRAGQWPHDRCARFVFLGVPRQRVVKDANEDEIGKALPEPVIRRLDHHLEPPPAPWQDGADRGRRSPGNAPGDLPDPRDTGRRPGEVVSLKTGCVEVIDGHHNLIYDNHKAVVSAGVCRSPPHRGGDPCLGAAPGSALHPTSHSPVAVPLSAAARVSFSRSPDRRLRGSRVPHLGPADPEDRQRGARHGPRSLFDPARITPYVLRHSYAQRHADAGVPVDVLRSSP